jgi:uncharacterized damage-inducible protein DinB
MADLLECLLQIKGLRHSVERLGSLAELACGQLDATGAALARTAAGMVAAERQWQSLLARALPERAWNGAPAVSADGTDPVEAFGVVRRLTLGVLDSCSAEDLAASTTAPGFGRVTVADIVAHMLAHDTEQLGALTILVQPD